MTRTDFLLDRKDFSRTSCLQRELPQLAPGQSLLKVCRFAFTANNITYAAMGEAMRYWEFFPAPPGQGIIPVWGFADVQASRCDGVEVGARYYGYYPMSTHVLVQPAQVNPGGFMDGSAHRLELPAIYNHHAACAGDPMYRADQEAQQMLLRPLFTTSFLLDDFFADNDFFGAQSLFLTSASSKTALGMAYLLHRNRQARDRSYQIIGLTSRGNRAFVEGLGCYERVLSYDEVDALGPGESGAIVDMAGDAGLTARLHRRLAPGLRYSCMVGASHWSADGGSVFDAGGALPGPAPQLFFAPTQAQKRVAQWGGEVFQGKVGAAWTGFLDFVESWLSVEVHLGEQETGRVYRDVLAGRSNPRAGYILSLHSD